LSPRAQRIADEIHPWDQLLDDELSYVPEGRGLGPAFTAAVSVALDAAAILDTLGRPPDLELERAYSRARELADAARRGQS
jgi:hypothetical protein